MEQLQTSISGWRRPALSMLLVSPLVGDLECGIAVIGLLFVIRTWRLSLTPHYQRSLASCRIQAAG